MGQEGALCARSQSASAFSTLDFVPARKPTASAGKRSDGMLDHLVADCGWDIDRHRIALSLQEHHVRRGCFSPRSTNPPMVSHPEKMSTKT
jgi:hypothetical protein